MRDMHRGTQLAGLALAITVLVAGGSTASAQQHHGQRVPADSATPAAGVCEVDQQDRYLKVDLEPEMPAPRCWEARPGQRLRVHNATTTPARLRWKPYAVTTIAPGATVTFDRPFASYLAPGDHDAHVSTYAGSGFEINLPSHRHVQPVSAG